MSLSVFVPVLLAVRWILRIAVIVFIADLMVGFVHWLEDNYGQEHWPLIGATVIAPNLLHHAKPRAFLKNNWWQSADLQMMAACSFAIVAAYFGFLTWELILFLFLVVNGNEVHKWAHRSRKENGKIISFLQDKHIVQSRAQHGKHHGHDRNTHYCAITEWVNPILEKIKFWRGLEWMIKKITGVSPRVDPVVLARRERQKQESFGTKTTQLIAVAA